MSNSALPKSVDEPESGEQRLGNEPSGKIDKLKIAEHEIICAI